MTVIHKEEKYAHGSENVKQDRIFPIFERACQYITSVTVVSQTRNWQGKGVAERIQFSDKEQCFGDEEKSIALRTSESI